MSFSAGSEASAVTWLECGPAALTTTGAYTVPSASTPDARLPAPRVIAGPCAEGEVGATRRTRGSLQVVRRWLRVGT